ncbi:hypothetical protein QOZ80_8AG0631820 [Eleusine coracana subsp. coracana]|nr:hypothetical protein QOZ80_8AG0631820 [Eleusine coracana subsp. coracana]
MQGEQQQQEMERLPPGFRFFPTDEELITCYLARKAADASFTPATIRDIDLYKFDPWNLPCQQLQASAARGDHNHQQECCYFFCTKGSKYSSGVRARRATQSGYWKSTGKDKAVYSSASGHFVGTKKMLVFYGGRAPSGKKTGWVMHEYALGESALLRGAQSEWVICRMLMKKNPSASSDRKPETEDTVHDQLHSLAPGHLLPVEPGGCYHEQDVAPPVDSHHADSQPVAHAMDGDEKDRPHYQMARDDE